MEDEQSELDKTTDNVKKLLFYSNYIVNNDSTSINLSC